MIHAQRKQTVSRHKHQLKLKIQCIAVLDTPILKHNMKKVIVCLWLVQWFAILICVKLNVLYIYIYIYTIYCINTA